MQADELQRANERLSALVELGLQLGSERDPERLLRIFCAAAREIVGARCAVVGITNGGPAYRHLLTGGMDAETAARVGRTGPPAGELGATLAAGGCVRAADPGLDAVGLPASFPPARSLLAAPVTSPGRVHGWVCLLDKLGADAFTEQDERLAASIAAKAGRAYENSTLHADLLRHSGHLAEEAAERARGEAALRDSEERFRGAFEHTGVAMVLTDIDNRFVRVNAAFARLFGYPEADMIGMTMADVTHPDDVAESYARREVLLAGKGYFFQIEKRYLHRDGHTFWGLTNVSLVRDREGRPSQYVGQVQDITERKRAEAELRRTADLLRAVADGTTDAVFVKDRDGRYLLLNEAAARFVGRTVAEVVGKDDADLFDPRGARRVMGRDRRIMETGEVGTSEETLTAAGVTRTFLSTKGPYRDEKGNVIGVVGVSRDITDRRRAEEAMQLRDRAMRAVTQGIVITDPNQPDNPVVYVSPGFERLTGYPESEAVGRNCRFLQGADTDAGAVAVVREAVRKGEPCTVELLNYRKNGTPFWNELSVSPVRDASGRVTHFVGVQTDVTERRQLEEQFRQSQKMEAVGRLAGGIAHDFNNLLTVINGYGDLALGSLPAGHQARELIREVVAAGERASGLTRQLLVFSRKAIVEPKVLDLRTVVADVDRMLRRILGEDIHLAMASDPDAGSVKADPGQLEQVILNLVVNARDAMPRGGRLTIEVRNAELDETYCRVHPDARPGPHVLLAVSDTGCGMDQATAARAFEPFFTTKGERGTGLGLATVHGIVRQAGGHVGVYSEVGRGTTFKIYLPRVGLPPASPSRLRRLAMPRGTETVLLVEDEDAVRALTNRILAGCGYTVLEARDGTEALRLAGSHTDRIALLVTDVVLPRMSGREVSERLAELHPGIEVLFLSGYTDDAVVRHGVLAAEVAFLQKPFTPSSLAAKVREVLDRRG